MRIINVNTERRIKKVSNKPMNVLKQKYIVMRSTVASVSVFLLLTGLWNPAWATAGLEFNMADPVYSTGRNRNYFTDMRIQTESGELEIRRFWTGRRWIMNTRWNDLLLIRNDDLKLPSEINLLTAEQINRLTTGEGLPNYILRNGEVFQATSLNPESASYRHIFHRTITPEFDSESGAITGYLWRNKEGMQRHYNAQGQIDWIQQAGKAKLFFERNTAGDIAVIKDSQSQILLTFGYEDIPLAEKTDFDRTGYRLTGITDYSGRSVSYSYTAGTGKLALVNDVRGYDWQMLYNDKHFEGFIDPEGRKTSVDINLEGVVLSYKNSDGVGVKYEYDYDKATEQFSTRRIQNDGQVTEKYYNQLGMRVGMSSNGAIVERQLEAVLSTGEITQITSGITTKWRRVWVSGKNALAANMSTGSYSDYQRCLLNYVNGTATSSTSGGSTGEGLSTGSTANPYIAAEEACSQKQELNSAYVKTRRMRDERGLITTYYYNQYREVVKIVFPDSTKVEYAYAPVNLYARRKVAEVDIYGVRTNYEYDENGNLTVMTEAVETPLERRTSYEYTPLGQRKKTTYHGNNGEVDAIWQWEYDNYGNVITEIDPYLNETLYSDYDALGNAHTITDANGHIWRSSYDHKGDLLSELNPYGQGESYSYDKTGFLKTAATTEGDSYSFLVNAKGLPTEIRDSLNHLSQINYDLANRPVLMKDAANNIQRLAYDDRGRISSYTDGENNTTQYLYNGGLLSQVQYPTYREKYSYDSGNRLTSIRQTADNIAYLNKLGYNISERLETAIDANSNESRTLKDELGRIVSLVDNEGGSTTFSYDSRDNLLQVEDPEGRTTTYTYNLRDELISETKQLQLNTTEQQVYSYDAEGNLQRHTNAKGEVLHYQYDEANRLTTITTFADVASADAYHSATPQGSPLKTISFSYNAKNQLVGYSDSNSSETRTYTARGLLESVTTNFGSFSKTYSYTYTANGLIKSYTSPEGQVYNYSYNKNNQISGVSIVGKGVINWSQFDWLQATTITLPGGNKISYEYDGLQRQSQRILTDPAANQLAHASYQYDGENNITAITHEGGENSYEYDKLYRLTSAQSPQQHTAYQYDGVGNRTLATETVTTADDTPAETSTAGSYNANNQLTEYGNSSYVYDANGNTIERVDIYNGQLRKTEYLYNQEQRLIAVKQGLDNSLTSEELATKTAAELKAQAATISPITIAEYRYNAYNQRIRKITSAGTTYYLYSEQGLAAEYDDQGQLIVEYHYKPQSSWMTNPISQNRGGVFYFYQNDHLGTPQRLLKTSGAVVWQADYKAFGEALVVTETVGNNLRFPGQYYDKETEGYYNFHRDYIPTLGRYLQKDVLGVFDGNNVYIYAHDQPLVGFDPLGLFNVVGAVVGAAMGAVCEAAQGGSGCKMTKGAIKGLIDGAFPGLRVLSGIVKDLVIDFYKCDDDDEKCLSDKAKDIAKKQVKDKLIDPIVDYDHDGYDSRGNSQRTMTVRPRARQVGKGLLKCGYSLLGF